MAGAILDDRKLLLIAFLVISDQYNFFFLIVFTKWPPATILDDRKSLLIAFIAISDQCATLFFDFYKIILYDCFSNIHHIRTDTPVSNSG